MSAAPGIVFFLSSEWSRYHRPGLLRAIAKAVDRPVLVVDNPVCLTTSRWQRPERWRQWRRHGGVASRLQTIGDNLVRLDAAVLLHDRLACELPGVRDLNRRLLGRQVLAALRHVGAGLPALSWFQFPTQHHYPGLLGEALAVYECYDEHADVPGLSASRRAGLIALERRLMARCGLVFTTSKPLFDARRAQHANVALSYNAADPAFFAPVAAAALCRVESRRRGPPTVGYLGTLHEHTDIALLAEIAERRPDWRLLVIGPVQAGAPQSDIARLVAAPNVEMLGWVDEARLPELLARFDVGVIPYRSGAIFNRYVNPNKLHEYTAMGKPVVVSPGLDISSNMGSVVVANGADEFIAAIAAAHATNSVGQVAQRLAIAQLNSWDVRAEQMLAHVERSLPARGRARDPTAQRGPPHGPGLPSVKELR